LRHLLATFGLLSLVVLGAAAVERVKPTAPLMVDGSVAVTDDGGYQAVLVCVSRQPLAKATLELTVQNGVAIAGDPPVTAWTLTDLPAGEVRKLRLPLASLEPDAFIGLVFRTTTGDGQRSGGGVRINLPRPPPDVDDDAL